MTGNTFGSIAIVLADADTGAYLEGAVFALYNAEGTYLNSYTTDANGWLCTDPVSYGAYSLVMVTAPEGYTVDSTPVYVALTSDLSYSAEYPWTVRVELSASGTAAVVTADASEDDTGAADETASAAEETAAESTETTASAGTDTPAEADATSRYAAATGDESNVLLWLMLLLAAGAALAGVTVSVRKNRLH